jgi:hypothetical protein
VARAKSHGISEPAEAIKGIVEDVEGKAEIEEARERAEQ